MITLSAQKRTSEQGVDSLRNEGFIPAVVYGPKQEAVSISVPEKDFEKVYREAGESSVVDLAGIATEPLQVLVHELDRDPVTNQPRHIDFYAIEKGAKIEVEVPLVFIGESPAVKAGANLVKVMHELPIEAAPADLPHDIQIDISVLVAIDDQIHVRDIILPKGVSTTADAEEVIALVQEVVEEKEEVPAAVDMEAIEVEKKGKEEEGGEEGEKKE